MWSRLLETYPEIQVVHRLDMCTSGLMLLAKNKPAESALKKQFQYRLTHKVYYARVWGRVEEDSGDGIFMYSFTSGQTVQSVTKLNLKQLDDHISHLLAQRDTFK